MDLLWRRSRRSDFRHGFRLRGLLDSASLGSPCCSRGLLDYMAALVTEHEVDHVSIPRALLFALLTLTTLGFALVTLEIREGPD